MYLVSSFSNNLVGNEWVTSKNINVVVPIIHKFFINNPSMVMPEVLLRKIHYSKGMGKYTW
jgi:hypothetical protein